MEYEEPTIKIIVVKGQMAGFFHGNDIDADNYEQRNNKKPFPKSSPKYQKKQINSYKKREQ